MAEEIKAYELAKKQREISIAEFFEKNRHLLGFDNKRKALLTAVKEAVDNSVEYNEPVVVRDRGVIKIVKIGEFIDSRMKSALRAENGAESAQTSNIEALVYDNKTLKLGFRQVSSIHRHPLRDKLFKITLTGNRAVKVTGSHSVFALKKGKIIPFKVNELAKGDYIAVPRKPLSLTETKSVLDIREWVLNLPKGIKDKIVIKGVSNLFKDIPADWKRFNYIPLQYFLNNNIQIPSTARVGVKQGRSTIPVRIKITPEFMRMLGYYAAEGTCYARWITYSFGIHEQEVIKDAEDCIKKTFGNIKVSRILAHKTALTLKLYSEILVYFFKGLRTGSKATTKKVPTIVFNVERHFQQSFLDAYILGDGHVSDKITVATVSKDLSIGLKYLFAFLGVPFSQFVQEESTRIFSNKYSSKCKKVYYLYVYRGTKNSPLNWLPLEESGFRSALKSLNPKIGSFNPHYMMINRNCFTFESAGSDLKLALLNKRAQLTDSTQITSLETLLTGDVGFLQVKSIEIAESESPYVYDFSVPGEEKFLGGEGVIFLHNSLDACEEAKILPEVTIELIEMSEERFRVIVEDNGPGIVKEQIPKVFAKLLYGSKFHHLQQKRGQQGIGISAAVLYSQLTTGKPAKITSRIGPKEPAYYYELNIDIQANKPEVVKQETIEWESQRGTKIEIELEAAYLKGIQSVDEYLKETAIINPHVTIIYTNPKAEQVIYSRSTEQLPIEPKEIKPHPYGVELGLLMRMLDNTASRTMQAFLTTEFSRVGPETAKEICQNSSLLPSMKPQEITRQQAEKLMEGIEKTKIIAPPTDCLSPISEALIEKGLRRVINAEYYCSTTRPPSVYRGNPFVIECCTGDTELMLENGQISTIKEYVENLNTKKVLSMNSEFKIVPTNVLAWHKFENKHKLLKITTRTGKTLKVTANNELPILEDGKVTWVKAEELMAGNRIATPRKIDLHPQIPEILELLEPEHVKVMNDDIVKHVLNILKTKYSSLKKVAKTLGVEYEYLKSFNRNKCIGRPTLKLFYEMAKAANLDLDIVKNKINRIAYVDNHYNNPIPVTLPNITEDLMYTLGLLDSDGYLSKACIVFVNKDETLHEVFKRNIRFLFGLEVKNYTQFNSQISNKTLYKILMNIKAVMSQMPNHLIISWLKGIVDGDGSINVNDGKIKSISIATAKHEQAKLVQTLLLRIGIPAKIELRKPSQSFGFINGRAVKTKKIKHDIVIQTTDDFKKFSDLISFRQVSRANKIHSVLNNLSTNARGDLLSLGNAIKSLRAENKLFQYELGFDDLTIREVEKGRQDMTRQHLQQIVGNKQLSGKAFAELKSLAFSDILWDKVVNIEEHHFEQYVYDLTTETGNFLADNIIMHNCGIAYGGEIPAEGSVTVLRFANRVPLLYQQGACSMTESIAKTNWKPYGLSQSQNSVPTGPIVVLVHMASVWVPFTSEAKEALAHYPEIIKEIKLALQECGRKVGLYIGKKTRATRQLERANLFESYMPEIADSLAELTGEKKEKILEQLVKMINKPEIKAQLEHGDNKDYEENMKLSVEKEEDEE